MTIQPQVDKEIAPGTTRGGQEDAVLPVLTFAALQLGVLLSGSIILEQVMGLPGIGSWMLTAIAAKDYPNEYLSVITGWLAENAGS